MVSKNLLEKHLGINYVYFKLKRLARLSICVEIALQSKTNWGQRQCC